LSRFFFERHHQVHDFARLGAAIQEIADLDEGCLSACPMVLLVYKTGALENGDEVVKVTVDIPNGDHGFRRLRWSLRWPQPR
jgi:tetrahydromethanopterin S-methyltransferase subunit A